MFLPWFKAGYSNFFLWSRNSFPCCLTAMKFLSVRFLETSGLFSLFLK
jgi:hypothetical protein